MPIPQDAIRCTGGELYAHVFENRATGVPRRLFWALRLDCEPLRWADDDWETSILLEWLTWPILRWPELHGMSLDRVVCPEILNASFYLSEHHDVSLKALSLLRQGGAVFRVAAAGAFSLGGFGQLDGSDLRFDVDGGVHFSGLYVVRNNLFPKPSTPAEASSVAARFIDLRDFGEPLWDGRFRYAFEPLENAV